jgi:hypothetical protein
MAVENPFIRITLKATAALTACQYLLMQLVSGTDFGVTVATGASDLPAGVLQNKPASGCAACVCAFGISKVKITDTVHTGDKLTATTDGTAIVTTTNLNHYWGFALAEGVTGDIIPMLVFPGMVSLA